MTTPDQATPKKKRGPPPLDPVHGAMSVTERAKRRRERVAAAVQLAFNADFPIVPGAAVPLAELVAVLTEAHRRIELSQDAAQAREVARLVLTALHDKLGLTDTTNTTGATT